MAKNETTLETRCGICRDGDNFHLSLTTTFSAFFSIFILQLFFGYLLMRKRRRIFSVLDQLNEFRYPFYAGCEIDILLPIYIHQMKHRNFLTEFPREKLGACKNVAVMFRKDRRVQERVPEIWSHVRQYFRLPGGVNSPYFGFDSKDVLVKHERKIRAIQVGTDRSMGPDDESLQTFGPVSTGHLHVACDYSNPDRHIL